jgi:hypothetical protein
MINTISPREVGRGVANALALFPVVVLTGRRQTDKSTLVKALQPASSRRYITLNTAVSRGLAAAKPQVLLDAAERRPLTIDHLNRRIWQRPPTGPWSLSGLGPSAATMSLSPTGSHETKLTH